MGQGTTASTAPVEVKVCAEFGQLPVLRAVAETIAVLADFNLDDVSDIKLAVDEVCSQLIKGAVGGAELVCTFRVSGLTLEATARTDTVTDTVPDERGFGWHVLQTLTDTITVDRRPPEHDTTGHRTTIVFTKTAGGDA
ncbi:ATP-binding protein [Rhodococcus sp. NPDC003318]|uniref:ATP-binding protein n=1 Tax=Rhodococcus sp. NPDC003318 TaxID=3364503 RepID=UPI00368A4973